MIFKTDRRDEADFMSALSDLDSIEETTRNLILTKVKEIEEELLRVAMNIKDAFPRDEVFCGDREIEMFRISDSPDDLLYAPPSDEFPLGSFYVCHMGDDVWEYRRFSDMRDKDREEAIRTGKLIRAFFGKTMTPA